MYKHNKRTQKPAKAGSATTLLLLLLGSIVGFYVAVRVAESTL